MALSAISSLFIQKPQKTIITPLDLSSIPTEGTKILDPDDFIWEGYPKEIIDSTAIRYLRSSLLHVLFQSLLAEQAARFLAMDNATNNAEDLIDDLTLNLNKLRQAGITTELLEIISAVDALAKNR